MKKQRTEYNFEYSYASSITTEKFNLTIPLPVEILIFNMQSLKFH